MQKGTHRLQKNKYPGGVRQASRHPQTDGGRGCGAGPFCYLDSIFAFCLPRPRTPGRGDRDRVPRPDQC
jgi:hypothetical protein